MKVSVKIDREGKNLTGISADIRKKMQQVIVYGINATRNTAVDNILRGAKSGETYVKYNPRRTHQASASGQFPASDTGFLANNIVTNLQGNGLEGEVISQAEYSQYLEYGTSKMGARPFMQPSLEQNRPKIRARLRKLLG
jgi:HK97 gp10 family phage protein|tara:strand:+ start:7023 stop:7442 length:420 start_codon:yes stop_codon:yes gene_type:complete